MVKKGKFEVPISIIKLVTNRDLKTRQPLKFDTIWLFCLASIIAKLRRQSFQSLVKCAVVPFFTQAVNIIVVKRFFCVHEHHKWI
jgi:hypothetical protein